MRIYHYNDRSTSPRCYPLWGQSLLRQWSSWAIGKKPFGLEHLHADRYTIDFRPIWNWAGLLTVRRFRMQYVSRLHQSFSSYSDPLAQAVSCPGCFLIPFMLRFVSSSPSVSCSSLCTGPGVNNACSAKTAEKYLMRAKHIVYGT